MSGLDNSFVGVLLDVSLKATLLLALTLLLVQGLRGARAALRQRLLLVALMGAVALLPLGALLPQWTLPLAPDPLGREKGPALSGQRLAPAPNALAPESQSVRLRSTGPKERAATSRFGPVATVTPPQEMQPAPRASARGLPAGIPVIALIWLLGASLSLLRQRGAHRQLAGLEREGSVADEVALVALGRAATSIGLDRPVRLLLHDGVKSPMTWGHRRPVVMLPSSHIEWSDERRTVVLFHELVHVSRGDWLIRVLARAACALYWFHPLAWVALSRLVVEQELACDETVLSLGTRPSSYAQHLLALARGDETSPEPTMSLPALPMARRRQLEVRLMSILRVSKTRSPARSAALALAAVLMLAGLVPVLAAVQPWVQETAASQTRPVTREEAVSELAAVVRELEQLEQKLQPHEARLETIQEEIEPTEELLETVEVSLEPFEMQLEEIERELEPFELELEAIQERLSPHEALLEEAEVGLEPFEGRLQQIEAELEPFEAQLAQLESQLEPFEKEMEAFEASVRPQTAELEARLAQLAEGDPRGLDDAQREELERVSEELRRQLEPLHQRIREAHSEMEPVFEEMRKIHEQMEPVHARMREVHEQIEPSFERMRGVHEQMEPVFEEMKRVHEQMEPVHARMREVHERMEPSFERMRELHDDMEPVHDRMREVHRKMEPVHAEMEALHERFEKSSRLLIEATLREELASLAVDSSVVEAVNEAVRDSIDLEFRDDHLRVRGSLNDLAGSIQRVLESRGVSHPELSVVSERAARALLDLDVEVP